MKNIEIKDLFAFHFVENVQYSTKGKHAVFEVAKADEK